VDLKIEGTLVSSAQAERALWYKIREKKNMDLNTLEEK